MTERQRGNGGRPTETWMSDGVAAQWRQSAAARNAALAAATELMLDLARLAPGMRVLDVGAGTGDTAILAAQRVGPTGTVLATDVAAAMLEECVAAARAQGLRNVVVRAADAAALDVPSGSFDAVISRNALQFVPDRAAAFACVRRALRQGGRTAIAVLGGPERNPCFALPFAMLHRVAGGAGAPPIPAMLSLGEPEILSAALRAAGFRDIEIHVVPAPRRFPSASGAADYARRSVTPFRERLEQLDASGQAHVVAAVEEVFARFAAPDGSVDMPGEMLVAAGTA